MSVDEIRSRTRAITAADPPLGGETGDDHDD
jgi:hypothetical protein